MDIQWEFVIPGIVAVLGALGLTARRQNGPVRELSEKVSALLATVADMDKRLAIVEVLQRRQLGQVNPSPDDSQRI